MRYATSLRLGLLAGLLLTGCASQTTQPTQFSGYLADYSQLQPATSATGAPVLRWISPQFSSERYTSVYVEKPSFYPAPAPSDQVSAQTLEQVRDYLHQALLRELTNARLRLVDTPSMDSLVLRSAITGVNVSTEGIKAYEVIPVALVIAAASTAAGTRDRDTEIFIELEALDARTSEPVLRVVRKGHGLALENSSSQLTLDDLKPVLDVWARDARDFQPDLR
ncbi:MAG TPA: DUF3313 domain-containing protein [Pseudomonas sp.]|uniref:DUF3313 domain-containing protein n=1 Tax=unclassified Pseudomonas TaxID=196821 RepID=UPI000EE81B35|nr:MULTISPECIES: DUF3313 domain-containing protein [Pseudomonas]MBH3340302.1 DUF3313 domain-containing protein [Pseudomonas mendocina]HBZ93582.1 DUF3313 domain-containing protein [Pseudomonas sp.]